MLTDRSKYFLCGLLILLAAAPVLPQRRRVRPGTLTPAAPPPNIIMIFADDLGYGDLGCYGARAIRTPHLDRMAREGLRLTHFYSAASVCTPSRAALMTGRYATRMGARQMHLSNVLEFKDETGLPQEETTVARALAARGYATAHIGKWHLGTTAPHRPTDHGFDYYYGIPYSNDMQPSMLWRGHEIIEQPVNQENLTERYTREAISFIERSRDRPFFLYLAHNMPHIPLYASARFRGRSRGGAYGDSVEEIDWSVGEVLAAVKRLGLDRRTLVVFSSDNGPWYEGSPGSLRGRKGWTTDGGVRVPGLWRWPGRIPANLVSDHPLSTLDFFPSVLAAAGETNASRLPLDGLNALPFLTRLEPAPPANIYLFFEKVYLQTARFGRWKIHVARWDIPRYTAASGQQKNLVLKNPSLYDMTYDDGESYNVAARHPEVVRELQRRIADRLRTFPAEIREANAELLAPQP